MLKRLKNWWDAERIGRVEEGTSQDMCPTNGNVIQMIIILYSPFWITALLVCFTHFVFGVSWEQIINR